MSRTLQGAVVLVTGGAGFIGSHLAAALADCRVRVLDDLSTGRTANLEACGAEIELFKGDVRNSRDVARALEGVRVVSILPAAASAIRSVIRKRIARSTRPEP